MAEEDTPQQKFQVLRVYTKDVSFESPKAPDVFLRQGEWAPKIGLQLNNATKRMNEEVYEMVLKLNVSATIGEDTIYLIEIEQAGLFHISGFEEPTIGLLLGSYCPATLFPFAREAICDLVVKGGFPQMLLEPINFDVLYQQHLQQEAAKAKSDAGATAPAE